MLKLKTDLEGKQTFFGQAFSMFKTCGYTLCGNWEYDKAYFDGTLWKEGGETIYIRLPFHVVSGWLDDGAALIEFNKPYVIKHVVNTGLDHDSSELLTAAGGLSQFQKPLDTDGQLKNKSRWETEGEQAIDNIVDRINEFHVS